MLELHGVSKSYDSAEGPVRVLNGVDLAIPAGTTVALTGESGSGKSTLLHLCAGLDLPDAGRITLDDTPLGGSDAERARMRRVSVGLVFQQFNLITSLSVAQNIAFQARLAGRFDPVWTAEMTRVLGLDGLASRYPEQISGGQQQRVAIGRALAARPRLLLADEPTGSLDTSTGDEVMALMLRLVEETGASLLMVTHSERLAARLGRRVKLAEGRIV